MSNRYTADGKRRSSMVHARRSHTCGICGKVGFGNGFESSHGRSHVRRGEAVELVKYYEGLMSPFRIFVPIEDENRIANLIADGFWR